MMIQEPDDNDRAVECPACAGEGRDIVGAYVYEPGGEHRHWGERDRGPCDYCGGLGYVWIEAEPRAEKDLDEFDDDDGWSYANLIEPIPSRH